ncbi:hypothetical protein BDW62DRAFT_143602 [Aspergillus aurantiobrunneus]
MNFNCPCHSDLLSRCPNNCLLADALENAPAYRAFSATTDTSIDTSINTVRLPSQIPIGPQEQRFSTPLARNYPTTIVTRWSSSTAFPSNRAGNLSNVAQHQLPENTSDLSNLPSHLQANDHTSTAPRPEHPQIRPNSLPRQTPNSVVNNWSIYRWPNPDEAGRFQCRWRNCTAQFASWDERQDHIQQHISRVVDVCPYPECQGKSFSRRNNFNQHMAKHHGRGDSGSK